MTNTSIEKTPAELQLNEGPETYLDAGLTNNDTRRRPLDALRAGTVLPCPPWCANDCDTGEGIVREVTLTGDWASETFVLWVNQAQDELLWELVRRSEESLGASSPISVKVV